MIDTTTKRNANKLEGVVGGVFSLSFFPSYIIEANLKRLLDYIIFSFACDLS